MTWVDYGIIAIIAISVLIALFRGFVREVVSLVVWVGGIMLTLHYLLPIESYVAHWVASIYLRYTIIILAVLIIVSLLSWLVGKILHRLVSSVGLGFTNRFFGFIFGFLRGIVVVSFLVILLPPADVKNNQAFEKSKLMLKVKPMADWFASMIPQNFTEKITKDMRRKLKEEGI
jgi:membrane protein required for colicin V production